MKSQTWILGALLLTVVTVIVYSPVRLHDFVNYDDGDYVVHNSHVQSGIALETALWALTTMAASNWHPLTWISHTVDFQLFGLDPAGHHLMSLGLHVMNALLLAWLLAVVTGAPGRSLLVAALFALHPLNVESVAWVAERKNVLSTLFFLLALIAYSRYSQRPSTLRYLTLVMVFALALASKPMVVTLPFVLLLMDYWPLQRIKGWTTPGDAFPLPQVELSRCLMEKVPLLGLSAASSAITVIAQRGSGAVRSLASFPIWLRLENAAYAYAMYLWKTASPVRLAVFYPHPGYTLGAARILLSSAVSLGLTWIAWRMRSQRPYLAVGWLWFLGTLVPVIGVIQVGAQAMADRYAYIPLIGIFIAVVWACGELSQKYRIKPLWQRVAAVVALLALSLLTRQQLGYWNDSYTLWSHALAVTADNPVGESQLGMALIGMNREEEAMARFQRAIALGTNDPTSYLNVGAYLNEHGRQQEAIPMLETALSLNKDAENSVLAHLNLGFAYTSIGDYEKARLHYRSALQVDRERVDGAIRGLTQFAAAHPSARDYMKLALLLQEAGDVAQAEIAYERVLRIDPNVQAARTALMSLRSTGR